ncbi:ATP-binding cassette domain-containing protein, partial [Candidatus Uhrbacteria bacterium]|nr:ATP-binding cassette domain-containing protein [Candidatus Uhrbacteria bacterium]
VSVDMPPGTVLAVIGPSGVGKSTLVRIMRRDLDPDQGSVIVNGDDIRDVRLASLLHRTSNIPQDSVVFGGTIRYNLVWTLTQEQQQRVRDEELWTLIQSLQLHERLTHGLDTLVGEGGIELSGGESQRLMIGAAFVREASCLFIDEATSNLDSTTERAVQELLKLVLARGKSAVIIAHRLSTVRICNKYMVMKPVNQLQEGESQIEVIADTFEEAYTKSATLRRLANDQGIVL